MAVSVRKWMKAIFFALTAYTLVTILSHSFYGKHKRSRGLSPRQHLLFVKTHKTGSSTVVNLFQRHAYANGLAVALPKDDDMFLGWPRLLTNRENIVLNLDNGSMKFNYVINHLIYRELLIAPLFSSEPTRVTLVRHPTEQCRSSFHYYEILKDQHDNTTSVVKQMERFFSNPARFDSSYQIRDAFVKSHTKNPQLADLGLAYQDMDRNDAVERHVQMILNNFNLVMVADMMEESCLLLKRLMRWSLKDIIFSKKNVFDYPGKADAIPKEVLVAMGEWNWGDNLLYWKAKEVLFKQMGDEPLFQEELLHFKQINTLVLDYCSQPALSKSKELVIEATKWNEEFTIGNDYCSDLLRKERPFTRLLQSKQRPDMFNHAYYTSIEDPLYLRLEY
ncbi:galactose-3-O-sulfotransferase 2-like [Watersipora subatra]|uniref:galactose-3-O-sulfotransferase 2-like n=1 Tax=Watersipora subatra TaxID=2589382 RepID=UPI00355BCF91